MIESSPPSSSAESNFRELDEVFLQTQTRIWLGEVLKTRLDEDLPLPDLLQDGEILFQVSKVVWDLLMSKCMELRHLKNKYGPFASKKSSGRYRPYSNVDSFLKICKIMGLSGIDLFSPSDVVEKRNIRKVCICIRALSKKARSKQLSAPDFDMVIYSVTMPTDMVGVIRRSLESPQCTLSSSSSFTSPNGSKVKLKQKTLNVQDSRDDDSCSSDGSDEAESRYMGENSFSSQCNSDNGDGVNSDLEDFDKASCCSVSKKKTHVNGEGTHTYRSGSADVSNTNFALENEDPLMGDSSCIDVGENNYIANYLAFSDLMVHATEGSSNSVVLDGENNMFDFFLNVDPGEKSFHKGSQRVYSDDEDMEVSSTTSMTSVLGRLLNLEFDSHFYEDDSSSTNVRSSLSKEIHSKEQDSAESSEPTKEERKLHTPLFDSQESGLKIANDNFEKPLSHEEDKEIDGTMFRANSDTNRPGISECLETSRKNRSVGDGEGFSEQIKNIVVQDSKIQDPPPHVVSLLQANLHENGVSSSDENGGQEEREDLSQLRKANASESQPPKKHKVRPLLKTVAKGTAIAGVMLLLLHIRKSNGTSLREQPKPSSGKQETRSVAKGVYPTERIRLGN